MYGKTGPHCKCEPKEIPLDDGSVICSEKKSNRWKFSTIFAPTDTYHPVSGTREFGFIENLDGTFTFYTRGVDRVRLRLAEILGGGGRKSFQGADNLWKSLQEGISNFVNFNGGSSQVEQPQIGRPDWDKLQDFIDGKIPLSVLGCKD